MIEKSVWLACGQAEAFRLFTDEVSRWWPATHRLSKASDGEVFLLASGRFFERTRDGREFEMGRVLEWPAVERIVLDFYLGTGPDHPTSVTITFTPESGGTRIDVRHTGTGASAALWNLRAPVFNGSWDSVLANFEKSFDRR